MSIVSSLFGGISENIALKKPLHFSSANVSVDSTSRPFSGEKMSGNAVKLVVGVPKSDRPSFLGGEIFVPLVGARSLRHGSGGCW